MMIKPWVKVAASFLFLFIAGAASERAFERTLSARRTPAATWRQAAHEIGVSPKQQRQIEAIFGKYQPRTDSVLTSLIPRLQLLTDSMHAEILAVLTPGQRERFASMQRPPQYVIKRKTPAGVHVDTLTSP